MVYIKGFILYLKILLFTLLTSCVSITKYNRKLEKIDNLKKEVLSCNADIVEFQYMMKKLENSLYREDFCERKLRSCNVKIQNILSECYGKE